MLSRDELVDRGSLVGCRDGVLVEAIVAGDRAAWNELVRRHTRRLWAVARAQGLDRQRAEDVVQTAWLELVTGAGRLRNPDAVGAWLATVVRNEAMRASRRAGRERPADAATSPERAAATPPPDAALLLDEQTAAVRAALRRLGARCRELLSLLFSDAELGYDEVSALLGMPHGSIGPTRRRCLDALRQHVEAGPPAVRRAGSRDPKRGTT